MTKIESSVESNVESNLNIDSTDEKDLYTSIVLTGVSYKYLDTKQPVFTNLNLVLSKQASKLTHGLYGVIGPSGVGKSTLISIIGGQLKPQSGKVEIFNTNIYEVEDLIRRTLICYQIQTATNIRGKVKENLLFGISDFMQITDQYLVELLKKVGLWNVFEGKDGLETLIGDGGLNLSGGQRQRLNFASLYLRAKHFKPKVVLIDEPTSSLDEMSEKAITNLIHELSESSVVFVVAHRLVTLKNADGIFDLTLIQPQNNNLNGTNTNYLQSLVPYSPAELLNTSKYYNDLINNKESLDE